jgi:uncharacterized protein (DUF2267 family)
MTAYGNLEAGMEKSIVWLKDMENSYITNEEQALNVLRIVLHSLRDRLTVDEAALFATQLPVVIRGLYFEDWDPSRVPADRNAAAFEREIQERLEEISQEVKAGVAIPVVFELLHRHVSPSLVEYMKTALPQDLSDFWPQEERVN